MSIDESSLTGETEPVRKNINPVQKTESINPSQMKNTGSNNKIIKNPFGQKKVGIK